MNRHWNDRVKCWSQQDKLIVDNCPVPWCVLAITANLFMYTSLDKYYKLQSNWRPSGDNIVYKEREIIFGIHIKFVSLKWNVDIRLFPLEHPPPLPHLSSLEYDSCQSDEWGHDGFYWNNALYHYMNQNSSEFYQMNFYGNCYLVLNAVQTAHSY